MEAIDSLRPAEEIGKGGKGGAPGKKETAPPKKDDKKAGKDKA